MSFIGDFLGSNTTKVKDFTSPGFDPNQYADPMAQKQTADQQQQFVNALQSQAAGTGGPSAAELMLKQSADAQRSYIGGMAAAQRGVNPGLAQRNAALAGANVGQQEAAQAAIARQQEQMNAQGLLGQNLGQMRQQDLSNSNMYNQLGNQYAGINAGVATKNAENTGKMVGGIMNGVGSAIAMMAQGGQVPSAGPQSQTAKFMAMQRGGAVPGQASVPGNSYSNDKVPAMLSPKEIVLPRSVTMSDDAPDKARAFVEALLRQKGARK